MMGCGSCTHRVPVWECFEVDGAIKRICGYDAKTCKNYEYNEDSQEKWLEDMERFINDQCGAVNMVALQRYLERAMKLGDTND